MLDKDGSILERVFGDDIKYRVLYLKQPKNNVGEFWFILYTKRKR